MVRTYELGFIIDPRVGEEEAVALADSFKQMVTDGGGTITKEESWGKRRLAYPINKLTEGRYIFLFIEADGANPFPEVEKRMGQSDQILRFLTVRTDLDLKRAARKGRPEPETPEGGEEAAAEA